MRRQLSPDSAKSNGTHKAKRSGKPQDFTALCIQIALGASLVALALFSMFHTQVRFQKISYVRDALTIGLLAFFVLRHHQQTQSFLMLFTGSGLLILLTLLPSAAYNVDSPVTFVNYLRIVGGMPMFFLLFGYFMWRFYRDLLFVFLLVAGAVIAALMFLTVTTTPIVSSTVALQYISESSRVYLHYFDHQSYHRATGVCIDTIPGLMAAAFVIIRRDLVSTIAASVFVGSTLTLGFLCGTRSALVFCLIFVAGALTVPLIARKSNNSLAMIALGTLGTLIATGIFAARSTTLDNLSRFSLQSLSDATLSGRLDFWRDSLEVIVQAPLGIGLVKEANYYSAHNNFLELTKVAGWAPGVLFFVLNMVIAVDLLLLLKRSRMSRSVLAITILFGIYMGASLVEGFFTSSVIVWQFTFILFGMYFGVRHDVYAGMRNGGRTARSGSHTGNPFLAQGLRTRFNRPVWVADEELAHRVRS